MLTDSYSKILLNAVFSAETEIRFTACKALGAWDATRRNTDLVSEYLFLIAKRDYAGALTLATNKLADHPSSSLLIRNADAHLGNSELHEVNSTEDTIRYDHYLNMLRLHKSSNYIDAVEYYHRYIARVHEFDLATMNLFQAQNRFVPLEWRIIPNRSISCVSSNAKIEIWSALCSVNVQQRICLIGVFDDTNDVKEILVNANVSADRITCVNVNQNDWQEISLSDVNLIRDADIALIVEIEALRLQRLVGYISAQVVATPMRSIVDLLGIRSDLITADAFVYQASIYPIEIPEISVSTQLDLLIIDLPARMQAQIPNGLGYLEVILERVPAKSQILDLDIILYHRYHAYRLLNGFKQIISSAGYEMSEDPWSPASFTQEWSKSEVIKFFRSDIDEIVSKIIKARPKILGISLHETNRTMARMIVDEVKKELADIIIMIGGYDCTYADLGKSRFPDFDYMVVREAELTLPVLMREILLKGKARDLPGIVSRYDSPIHEWQAGPEVQNIDTIPNPRYGWVESLKVYFNHNGYCLTPVLSSRGCVWSRCLFCAERFAWRKRDSVKVVDELQWLMYQGMRLFQFNDSDLNGDPQTTMDICKEVVHRKLKPQFIGQMRIHKKNDSDFYKILKAGGFSHIRFGVDALSKKSLKLQKKGYTIDMVEKNLRRAKEAGIVVSINVVLGVPGETFDDIDEMIFHLKRLRPYIDIIENINPLMLVYGSVYYETPEKFNIYFTAEGEEHYRNSSGTIPDAHWYSLNPYIGPTERKEMLLKIYVGLHDIGYNIGPYAEAMIKKRRIELDNAEKQKLNTLAG